MKIKELIVLLLIVISFKLYAQNNYIGIYSGINLSKIDRDNLAFKDPSAIISYAGGLSFEHGFKRHFLFNTGISYNRFGFKQQFDFTDNFGNPVGKSQLYFYYDYLSVPITMGYKIGDKMFVSINAGLNTSYLIDAKHVLEIPSNLYPYNAGSAETTNFTSSINRLDLGGIVTIGCGIKLITRYVINSDVSYRQSFSSISNSKYFPYDEIKNYGFSLSIGLKYAISKE